MWRYSQEMIVFLVASFLLCVSGCWTKKENVVFNGNVADIEVMEGEIFLEGPDERRVPFRAGRDEAREIIDIISQGQPAADCKCQGRAYFYVHYTTGTQDHFEVTDSEIVRVNGRPISIDMDRLVALLQRIETRISGQ